MQSPSQHPKADTGESGPPRGLVWIVASSQPSTDPVKRCLLARGQQGFGPHLQASRSATRWAYPLRQEERFTSTAVGELTRVNMACRAHGTTRAEKRPPQDTPPHLGEEGIRGLGAERFPAIPAP